MGEVIKSQSWDKKEQNVEQNAEKWKNLVNLVEGTGGGFIITALALPLECIQKSLHITSFAL